MRLNKYNARLKKTNQRLKAIQRHLNIESPCSPVGSEVEESDPEVFEDPFAAYEAGATASVPAPTGHGEELGDDEETEDETEEEGNDHEEGDDDDDDDDEEDIQPVRLLVSARAYQPANSVFLSQQTSTSRAYQPRNQPANRLIE